MKIEGDGLAAIHHKLHSQFTDKKLLYVELDKHFKTHTTLFEIMVIMIDTLSSLTLSRKLFTLCSFFQCNLS